MEEALVGLVVLVVYGAVATVPIGIGVVHHRRLMGDLDGVGAKSQLRRVGKSPPWQTHGKGCTWIGGEAGRNVQLELRMDPKRKIYAKLRVELRRDLSDGLALSASVYATLHEFGFRSLKLVEGSASWRLVFIGGDRFSLLADLNRWDPSRDKGAIPKDTGNEAEARIGDGWLELGYRGVTEDRMARIVSAQVALVEALEIEEDRHWVELQAAHGLERNGDEMRGVIEGVAVDISCVQGVTRIKTACKTELEAAHKDHLEGSRSLKNPVLGMLVGVRGPADLDIDALLDDEALVEDLLGVVHAWPGSRVRPGSITLHATVRIREKLADAVEHIVRLTKGLEERG